MAGQKKKGPIQRIKEKIEKYSFVFTELVKRDFKKQYNGTVLGLLWSLVQPLLRLLIMWVVFSQFFGRNTPHYAVYLFSGLIVFIYFSTATSKGLTSLRSGANIYSKVKVPKYLFLFASNVSNLINFLMMLVAYFVFVAIDGIPFTWKFLTLIYPTVCLTAFNVGVGMVLSGMYIFFKDTKQLYELVIILVRYMSAIFYNINSFSEKVQTLFLINPVYVYIKYFRMVVIDSVIPPLWYHALCLGYALLFVALGSWMYVTQNKKYLYYV